MTVIKRKWRLNIALTAPNINTGKLAAPELNADLAKLRGQLMQYNGMTDCTIKRYSITMHFDDDIINVEAVERMVKEAVLWATRNTEVKLFTLRNGAIPTVTRAFKNAEEKAPKRGIVTVTFNGYITPFYIKVHRGGWDKERFYDETFDLRNELVNIDGLLDYELRVDRATLIVDLRIMPDLSEVEAHMRAVFKNASCGDFFPYVAGDLGLELAFSQRKE